jgi:enamine deaminase RidA (YjgF/YER057c/UK114 family)
MEVGEMPAEPSDMARRNVYSGTPWEPKVAYCRAKRVGALVFVSGTVSVDEHGAVVGPGDLHAQTRFALSKIERALRELGADLTDVVRTRTFVTDISRFEDFARAHREVFAGIDPVATCVEVQRLVSPELLVEVEVDAVVQGS